MPVRGFYPRRINWEEASDASSADFTIGKEQVPVSQGEGRFTGPGSIVTGDVIGSYIAIGHGAQVIVDQALSMAEELEKRHEIESRMLARAVVDYVEKLQAQIPRADQDPAKTEPYKSLLPYRLADAPFFFGRDRAKGDLLRSIGDSSRGRLTVLHSESGAGKTSLLLAGLAAELLASNHLPLYVRAWRASPSLAIKQALLPDLSPTPGLAEAPLRAYLGQVTDILGLGSELFILLDQFEEFFIRIPDEAVQIRFIEDLGDCVDAETLRVHFVLSLRDDQFARLSDFRPRIPYIFANEYPLKLLTHEEANQAITAPAEMADLAYEPGLVEEILAELEANPGQMVLPAQLQLVCWALYRRLSGTQQTITREAFRHMEGVAGILRNYLRNVLEREIPPGQREQARRVLEALVRSDRSRDLRTEVELRRDAGPAETLPEVLDHLVNARLLRAVETRPEVMVAYELAHDYLVDQIELDPELLARKAAQELLDQEVDAWLRNPKLRIGAEKLSIIRAQEKRLNFTSEARELYGLSKQAQRRRRGTLIGLLGTALLVGLVAILLYQSLGLARTNLGIAEQALVTATGVIQSAKNEAAEAESRKATAELLAGAAQATADVAETAGARAVAARATADYALQDAEIGLATAIAAEQTAIVARNAAQARQTAAMQNEATAIAAQETAQAAEAQAIQARATAEARRATAVANQATAQAQQVEAEAAAEQAIQAQAQAEAARQAAEEAQRAAEEAARQAEEAAKNAKATRTAVEALRATAEADLARTRQLAAIIRQTQNCVVDSDPTSDPGPWALAYDGDFIWVANRRTQTLTKLRVGDCSIVGSYPSGSTGLVDVTYGGGLIWVVNLGNELYRIDPATGGTLGAPFSAGPSGHTPTALLYAGGALWVTSAQNVVRKIDPATGAELGTYDTGGNPVDLAFDGSHVWVANENDNTVSRFEAATGLLRGVFPVELKPAKLTFDGDHIWVANRESNTLSKLRVSDGQSLATFDTGPGPTALAFDGVNIWSANVGDNTLSGIDARNGTRSFDVPTAWGPSDMLFDGANMWVVAADENLVQRIPVTLWPVGRAPVALSLQEDHIWVANSDDHTLSKVPVSSNELTQVFAVDQGPVDLTTAGSNVWVAHGKHNTISKIKAEDGATLGVFSTDGNKAAGIAFDGSQIWAITKEDNSVICLREADGAYLGTTKVGDVLVDILYDGQHVWVADSGGQALIELSPDGAWLAAYPLGIAPETFTFDETYFWVAYRLIDPTTFEVRLLQIRASDGAVVSTISTIAAPGPGPATIANDGRYLWLASRSGTNTTFGVVVRIEASNPAEQMAFRVCYDPSDLIQAKGGIWVACHGDNLIQKLPVGHDVLDRLSANGAAPFGAKMQLYLPIVLKD